MPSDGTHQSIMMPASNLRRHLLIVAGLRGRGPVVERTLKVLRVSYLISPGICLRELSNPSLNGRQGDFQGFSDTKREVRIGRKVVLTFARELVRFDRVGAIHLIPTDHTCFMSQIRGNGRGLIPLMYTLIKLHSSAGIFFCFRSDGNCAGVDA